MGVGVTTQFGGFVPDSLLPWADCESGPSCSDLRAAVGDLGFTSLRDTVRPSVVVAAGVRRRRSRAWVVAAMASGSWLE